jgi:hypothetical protein
MLKTTLFAALLAGACVPALATDYFLVVPVKGKTEVASAIQVALAPSVLPGAQVGTPVTYDFSKNLVVTGDPQFTGAGVAWTVGEGALPAGLSVDPASGVLRGTPTVPGTAAFSVNAAYKSKSGQQTYELAVVGAPHFTVAAGTPTSLALVGVAMGAASVPSVIQLKNSGNYSGALPLPSFSGADAAQFTASTTCTNVSANGSCAVSVTWTPAASQATATLVLDGATYTFNGNMKQFATWDPANDGAGYILSNNNLTVTNSTGSLAGGVRATVGKSSGKWYWEVTADGLGRNEMIGIAKSSFPTKTDRMCFGCDSTTSAQSQWRAVYPSSHTQTAWTASTTSNFAGTTLAANGAAYGDTYGFALDADAQTLTIYYTPVGGSCVSHAIMQWSNIGAATWYPAVSTGGQTWVVTANFGAAAFKCAAPAGYQVL